LEDCEHWVFGFIDIGITRHGNCGIVCFIGIGHCGYKHTKCFTYHLCQDFVGSNVEDDDSGEQCFVKRQNLFRFEVHDDDTEVKMPTK
jgi:hypothetical protein